MRVDVGGEVFPTKRALIDRSRKILYGHALWVPLPAEDVAFLCALLARHRSADKKIGAGVATIQVAVVPPYETRGFEIMRVDGTRTDFSFLECLRPSPHASRLRRALRFAVRAELLDYRVREFEIFGGADGRLGCAVTGAQMLPSEAHVDHVRPVTFEHLVRRLLEQHAIHPNAIELLAHGDGDTAVRLADSRLEGAWRSFHSEHARLRIISSQANLRGSVPKSTRAQKKVR